MTLLEIIRMLRDKDGWQRKFGRLDDEVTYKDTEIYTCLDCDGAMFRVYEPTPEYPDRVVYETPLFLFPIVALFVRTLRRYLERKELTND